MRVEEKPIEAEDRVRVYNLSFEPGEILIRDKSGKPTMRRWNLVAASIKPTGDKPKRPPPQQ